ncbi:MAG TPA: hypothetical protein VFB96_14855 [Pirellulaceae bacterium]|nr:hypothetical protein [Pirellulaceae bacterium]
MFVLNALGSNALLLPVVALVATAVVLLMLLKGKGPAMVGAILLVVPMPIYWSLLSLVSGLASAYGVLALSEVEPKPSELYLGYSAMWVNVQIGLWLNVPIFLLAAGGLMFRAWNEDPPSPSAAKPIRWPRDDRTTP